MPVWIGAAVFAAVGVVCLGAAHRYRSGRSPRLGRNRRNIYAPVFRRNAVFFLGPMGLLSLAGVVLVIGPGAWPALYTVATLVALASLVAAGVFAYRPPRWLMPPDERRHRAAVGS